jgi:hypothetical protein
MGTQTATLRFTKPTINADGNGAWPADLNLDMDLIDRAINQVITVSVPDTNVSLEADGTNSDQALYAVYNFTGALTADRTITLPASVKIGYAINSTTGGHNVILSAGGTTLAIGTSAWNFFYCDGTNVTGPALGLGGAAQISGGSNGGVAITGSNTNDSAAAGQVGEVISANVTPGSAVALGNGLNGHIAQISLTAGDWDVWGNVVFAFSGTSGSSAICWISSVFASSPSDANGGALTGITTSSAIINTLYQPAGMRQISLSSTTTIYLAVTATFSGTATAYGFIGARRMR